MKVIDILLEAVPGSGQLARLILPAAARAWNAEKQAAFREAVKALEDTLYLARSQAEPIATSQLDAYKVIQKAAPAHVADKEFAQAVFNTAEERVAQRLGGEEAARATQAAKEKAESEAAAKATKEKEAEEVIRGGKSPVQKANSFMKWGLGGYIGYDIVVNSYQDYYNKQAFALEKVKSGKWTVEQAKTYDAKNKVNFVLNVGASILPLTVSWAAWILKGPFKIKKWIYKERDPVTGKVKDVPLDDLVSDAKSGIVKKSAWAAMLALMNSESQTLPTQNWKLYDENGNDTGKTVGRALTFRECLAYWAFNHSFGRDTTADFADDFNAAWNALMPDAVNFTTQKQDIEKAAGKKVTPNVVAKPPEVVDGIRIHNR